MMIKGEASLIAAIFKKAINDIVLFRKKQREICFNVDDYKKELAAWVKNKEYINTYNDKIRKEKVYGQVPKYIVVPKRPTPKINIELYNNWVSATSFFKTGRYRFYTDLIGVDSGLVYARFLEYDK